MGNKKNTHTILYPIVRSVLNVIFYKGFKLHVEGQENIPATGAIIAAPNHKSDWDPPLVGIAFPNRVIHYMAKEELFKNPVFARILKLFGTFPVKRGAIDTSAIMRAVRELKQGNILGIFPEGTRIRKDGLGRFHSGMASIAMMAGVDILPIAVLNSRELPRTTEPPAVLIGRPIHVKKQKPDKGSVEAINQQVRAAIEQMAEEYRNRKKN